MKTAGSGAAEIQFIDDTTLTIGENSEVLLDKFVFDGAKARNATVEIVRGTLRFVSGSSDDSAYQIKTPVAVIGVRGTVIDVSFENNEMVFNTVEGLGVVCHGSAGCRDVRAGESPLAINRLGFFRASPAQAARLLSRLEGAHQTLSRRIGRSAFTARGWQRNLGGKLGKQPGQFKTLTKGLFKGQLKDQAKGQLKEPFKGKSTEQPKGKARGLFR
ncbi:MAG: FecR domain-containing protein [Xanthobacteraceae bacterium]|nr:FecR domain-containing protein [Xanthobacteraceae bacterium]